ncbi:MAG: TldD/PmbA family protein [Promethearchaeota archaeon]
MEIDTDKLLEMANFAINRAKKAGMDGAFVNAGLNQAFSTRFANSAIHQNFVDFRTSFEITVIKGQKRVGVSTNSLEERDITWAVDRAIKMVVFLPDDPEFPGILTEPQNYPKLQLNDPKAKNLTSSDVVDKIIGGINTGHEFSPKVQTVSGNLNLRDGFELFLSSEGLENLSPVTEITSTINIMADDGKGESRSNSNFGGRRFSELPFENEANEVAQRAILGLNAQKIEPKAYDAILDYQAVADQTFFLGYALSAKMVLDQVSFLKDKVGEQVFADSLTLINDPHDPSFLGARPLDMEGVATQKYTLINQGVIENFAHSRLTASKMGTKTNGCGLIFLGSSFAFPFAAKIKAGQLKRQKMIDEMDDGLLITNLHYTNFIDMSRGTETGMTKDGVFIIRNGEIVGAARDMRFTDSIPRLFSTAKPSHELQQIVNWFGLGFAIPAIQVNEMNFTSAK